MSKRKQKSKAWFLAEYAALRVTGAFVRLLPRRCALALGRSLGRWFYRLSSRGNVALDNIMQAYDGSITPDEAERIARAAFVNITQSAVESVWMQGRLTPERIDELILPHNTEALREALDEGRGAILVTGHIGNWELGAHWLSRKFGPTFSVARPLRNPYVDRYLCRFREEAGQRILERSGALKQIVKSLRAGKLVVMLVDQHAHSGGIQVKFFGRDAWTLTAPAAIAIRMGCPVVIAHSFRDDDRLHHHIVIDDVVRFADTGDRALDVRRGTEYITQRTEMFIREHPEQWFWLHRRWKPGPLVHPKGARVERHERE